MDSFKSGLDRVPVRGGVGSGFLANASHDLATTPVRDADQPVLGHPLLLLTLQGVYSGKSIKSLSNCPALIKEKGQGETIRTNRRKVLFEKFYTQ
jgi:hypothetical protein